jgi:dTDP-4-dehydrorhamnose reductase
MAGPSDDPFRLRTIMSKKLVIFGGKGFVGENLMKIAQGLGWEVFVADVDPDMRAGFLQVNITDQAAIDQLVETLLPTAIVNVAAIADIDRAEREKDLAYQVNVQGARSIAESCARRGIRYVFFSSDAVFDGEGSQYSEDDPQHPVNYYGQTKAEAEQAVLQTCPTAAVVRISLVLGYPVVSGNAFFANLESKLREKQPVSAPTYEIRTPVDVITLTECVLELCSNDFCGVLHIGTTDSISRYDLSVDVARRMGFVQDFIQPQLAPEAKPGRAPRHKNGIINVAKAQRILKTRLLSTQESIQRAFNERQDTLMNPNDRSD